MSLSKNYLNTLKSEVLDWELADKVLILKEKVLQEIDAGFLRVKITLKNNDILELSEYVQCTDFGIVVKSYTYHWQNSNGELKKHWDNARHHFQVSTNPHHLHDGEESHVTESDAMNFEKVREIIEEDVEQCALKN